MEQLQSNSSSSSSFNYPFQHWADLVNSETSLPLPPPPHHHHHITASQNSSSALLDSVLYTANPLEAVNLWHLLRSDLPLLAILSTHLVTFLVGVTGNLAVIVSWTAKGGDGGSRGRDQSQRCSARHQLHQPTTTFMMSLAAADLLRLTFFLPLETAEYFVTRWDRLGLVCRLSTFVEMFSCAASVLNLVAVSVERFLVIVQPMRARNWCTVCKSRRTVARLKKVTYFTGEIGVTAYHCFEMEGQWAVFCAFYELFLLLVLPALLMTFCYFRVILKLKSSTRQMGNGGILSEKCKNEKNQDFLIRPSSSNNNIQWWRCKVRKNGGKQKKLTKNMAVKTSRKNSNGCFFSRFQSTIRLPCRSFCATCSAVVC
ncbi:hypothetical protein TYRP_019454 [Tyrophagus putrescentiae]|nr:hypothetical protein TYRP_019454 [Tyrophagus putrescentiae]